MRFKLAFLPLFVLLAACSSKPHSSQPPAELVAPKGGFLLEPSHAVQPMFGDFASNPVAEQFIDKMVAKHGFDRQQLHAIIGQAKRLDYVLRLMDRQAPSYTPPSGPNGAWIRYRNKFITPDNVQNGVAFWNQYQDALQRAQQVYGVPPEIIVGIIGVETRWGRIMGKTRILDALATLSFDLKGSFAGAMGYGQFMPSSYKSYAVDFNGDGHINLWDPVDAIGSVAHYFQQNGWRPGENVAVPASGQAPMLDNGFKTRYSVSMLAASGLSPQGSLDGHDEVSLLRLDLGTSYQYWYGLPNFYAITRYNNSTHYAMTVWQLGEAVSKARQGSLF